MMKAAFIFVLFVAAISAQVIIPGKIERIFIDDFSFGADTQDITIVLDTSGLDSSDPNIVQTLTAESVSCQNLVGCSRDMEMRVTSGPPSRFFQCAIFSTAPSNGVDPVFPAEWSVSNPKLGTSIATLQYDGIGNGFNNPQPVITGLGGVDFTDGGTVDTLFFSVSTDLDIIYTIEIYDQAGGICQVDVSVPSTIGLSYEDTFIEISINSFSGCNLANVGAVEFFLPSDDAVDATVRSFSWFGPPDPSPSATPTRTPSPAASASNTPAPSASPSRTPSPSGPCIIQCVCPSFTCRIAYDVDDDENLITFFRSSAFFFDDSDDSSYYVIYVDDEGNPEDDTIIYVTQTDGTSFFTSGISTFFSTIFSTVTFTFSTGFSTFYTSFFTSLTSFYTSFFTSFTTFGSSFTSIFGSSFTSFGTSFTSFGTSFTSFNFGSSSSSDAGTLAVSVVMVVVLAAFA